MCHESPHCNYFSFNPMTGTDRCSKPKNKPCPDIILVSNCCDAIIYELDSEVCPKCCEPCDIVEG